MKTIIKKSIYVFISLILCLVFVSNSVLAARINGEVIFAKDLAVGEIVTVQIATGTNKDAMVVGLGECPRLVLLENLGFNNYYKYPNVSGSQLAYDLSDLKTVINTRTVGHGDYIFNISAPFLYDIAKNESWQNISGMYYYRAELIDARLTLGGSFWTRTPYSLGNNCVWIAENGYTERRGCYSDDSYYWCGVRPAFNLKSDTVLKYNSATAKYTVTTTTEDLALAFFQNNGFDTVIYVPQGQSPTGYTALTGYTGVYYKQINNRFLFIYAQEYTPPTSIGSLNIN